MPYLTEVSRHQIFHYGFYFLGVWFKTISIHYDLEILDLVVTEATLLAIYCGARVLNPV